MTMVKPIPGTRGYYVSTSGDVWGPRAGLLKPSYTRGYQQVGVHRRTRRTHELVLTTFLGPRPEGYVGRHLDGNTNNNYLENLVWGTPKENMKDQELHGTRIQGQGHPRSRLSDEEVMEILDRLSGGEVGLHLAEEYSVYPSTISRIKRREGRFGHLG